MLTGISRRQPPVSIARVNSQKPHRLAVRSRAPPEYHSARALFISILLVFGFINSADAQLLDYGPFAGYGLKKGILGSDYSNPFAACIKGKESPLTASRSAVRVSIVYNADEYKQAFHIDQKAEASFLGIGGGGEELHFGQENSGSSSAFDIVIEAYGEHDSQTVDNIAWDPKYDAMLKSGDPAKIEQ